MDSSNQGRISYYKNKIAFHVQQMATCQNRKQPRTNAIQIQEY